MQIHSGHVTSLAWWEAGDGSALSGCFVSGGQDGVVRVWDPRDCSNVAKLSLHVNMKGRGAVGDILAGEGREGCKCGDGRKEGRGREQRRDRQASTVISVLCRRVG